MTIGLGPQKRGCLHRVPVRLAPLLLFLLSSSPVAAQPCALMVQFGSYAMGIDRGAAVATERLVSSAPGVTRVTRVFRGREGEYALCVDTVSEQEAMRLATAIRRQLPPKPRGPITIAVAGNKIHVPPKER